ncbi:trypsin Inhibitor like cysteine rich domain protein [Oesophagostomum dentatum]|uniref:Trypsin Inhibitor like cysteine rich domain protein n=1 Tax=Oesophagostomum dentatum TaxID=61180 RepID=A0A0B1T242_OESDE|nr:trypsin Inhibitor like cysteine rich domain protein [Oesophagostomum dentatum]
MAHIVKRLPSIHPLPRLPKVLGRRNLMIGPLPSSSAKLVSPHFNFMNNLSTWLPKNKKCGKNEKFYECGTACEPTCNVQPGPCTDQCVMSVCQCKSGYKRGPDGCQLPGPEPEPPYKN